VTRPSRLPEIDLEVSQERMGAIRDDVREQLVNRVHALRLTARLYRKAGLSHMARKKDEEADRTVLMIASIE
jgi:hypothetical protein